jgi:ABC-type transport system substrate-binding protein
MINNAQYKNQTLKNYLAELNQSSNKTKQRIITAIQDIYRKDVPFVIL